jgi:hypothetical protein
MLAGGSVAFNRIENEILLAAGITGQSALA